MTSMRSSRRRRATAAFVGVLLATGIAGSALSQQAAPETNETTRTTNLISSGWTLTCKPDPRRKLLACEASQTIAVAKSRETLLAVFVTPRLRDDATMDHVLRFQLPHGLDLASGIRFRVDAGEELSPVVQTSSQAAVFARTELTAALLTAMKKGETMTVDVNDMNGNRLTIPVTLAGFSAVHAKLR